MILDNISGFPGFLTFWTFGHVQKYFRQVDKSMDKIMDLTALVQNLPTLVLPRAGAPPPLFVQSHYRCLCLYLTIWWLMM